MPCIVIIINIIINIEFRIAKSTQKEVNSMLARVYECSRAGNMQKLCQKDYLNPCSPKIYGSMTLPSTNRRIPVSHERYSSLTVVLTGKKKQQQYRYIQRDDGFSDTHLVSSGCRQRLVFTIGLNPAPTDLVGAMVHGSPCREKYSPPPNAIMTTTNTIRNCPRSWTITRTRIFT